MSYANLLRWSGLAALMGGALLAVVDAVDGIYFSGSTEPESIASSAWILFNALDVFLLILISIGLVGLYVRQARQAGTLGLIGFLVFYFGIALFIGSLWTAAFILPWLAGQAPPEMLTADPPGLVLFGVFSTILLFSLGGLLFGLASLRAGILPRGAAVLLMVGAVLTAALELMEFQFSGVLVSVALAWMGYAVWTSGEAAEAGSLPELTTT